MLFIKPYTQCSIVHYTVGVHDGRFSEGGKEYEYIYIYIHTDTVLKYLANLLNRFLKCCYGAL